VTRGWKTSEFWLTVAVQVALYVQDVPGLPSWLTATAAAIAAAGYAVSRGLAKRGQ